MSRGDTPRCAPPSSVEWGQFYLPHYFAPAPADFHEGLFAQLADLHTRRDTNGAIIAPREGAKSTVVTLAYFLRCAVERLEPYLLILSDSGDLRVRYGFGGPAGSRFTGAVSYTRMFPSGDVATI